MSRNDDDDLAIWFEYCAQIPVPERTPDDFNAPQAPWRQRPPSEKQLAVLRKETAKRREPFQMPRNSGEASDRIAALYRKRQQPYVDDEPYDYMPPARDYGDL